LEVDGGVNLETIGECTAAGADLLVVGSAISSGNSYRERFAELEKRIK
jgi:ribulose-phosphate 3-epimerase